MEGSGDVAQAPAAKARAKHRATYPTNAQSLALSRSDKEAEKVAMERAEEQVEEDVMPRHNKRDGGIMPDKVLKLNLDHVPEEQRAQVRQRLARASSRNNAKKSVVE